MIDDCKAVLFDLDGTLVSTRPEYRYFVVTSALEDLGVLEGKKYDIDRFWFAHDRDTTIAERFGVNPVSSFWKAYKSYDTPELREQWTEAYDDVPPALGMLKERGLRLGIVTGAPPRVVPVELALIDKDKFDAVIFARKDHGLELKPHPAGIEECLRQMHIPNNKAIYVGNAREDIECARNAGVLDVLIDRGEFKFEGLEPSMTIKSLYELEGLIGSKG
jgi:HAD superfamily hydrolase (TIGR01549 family)